MYEQTARELMTLEGIKLQYFTGAKNPAAIEPAALLAPLSNVNMQLAFFRSNRTKEAVFPPFQAYFREHQPSSLAVWEKNDPFFVPPGAEAFKQGVPSAEVHLIDASHFALETNFLEIANIIGKFLSKKDL
ncbi:hypothetical protein MMC25_003330 [Agyrium rufum]|nr:hypothetical protein [Agyrium rufum]